MASEATNLLLILLMGGVPAAIGVILALRRARRRWELLAITALCCLVVVMTYREEFVWDPDWPRHVVNGVLHISGLLILFDVLPVLIGYEVTRWMLGRRNSSAQQTK